MKPTVIVTGASRGIGAATAILLGERGFNVCVNFYQNAAAAYDVVQAIVNEGGSAMAIQGDVSNEMEVHSLFERVESTWQPVNYLVNNAGILETQCELTDISAERFDRVYATNVKGSFLCCKEALSRFTKGGAIVNVSSVAARTGSPFEYVDYACSKGAIDSLTKGVAMEAAKKGIRVNAVRPGFIYTQMHADGGEPNRVDRLAKQIPLQRGGQASEVASAIAFLLSDDASYITGETLDIAGGR